MKAVLTAASRQKRRIFGQKQLLSHFASEAVFPFCIHICLFLRSYYIHKLLLDFTHPGGGELLSLAVPETGSPRRHKADPAEHNRESWAMKISLHSHQRVFEADLSQAVSLAITLQFDRPQPNHFAAPKASSKPLKLGDFVGDTSAGGSCNVSTLQFIPHCNGTHTETISHIVNEDVWAGHAASDVLCAAAVITVETTPATNTRDTYRPALDDKDTVVTADAMHRALAPWRRYSPAALIVRTRPNDINKKTRQYAQPPEPAFFTCEAMDVINETDCRHLLVDLPSVDRMYDDGRLTNHHIFWAVPENSHRMAADSRQDRTITEMIFVPEDVPDGVALLNLQVPALAGDAAPSRPMLLPVQSVTPVAPSH